MSVQACIMIWQRVVTLLAQELEQTLESLRARAGAGVAMAETAGSAQPLAPHLTQFAEAQRIIVLDAVRTDFSPSGQSSDAGSSSKPPSMRGMKPTIGNSCFCRCFHACAASMMGSKYMHACLQAGMRGPCCQ